MKRRTESWTLIFSLQSIDDGGGTGHTSECAEEMRRFVQEAKSNSQGGKKISNEVECADDERKNVWRKNGERSAELI